jgi:hypothetical protein
MEFDAGQNIAINNEHLGTGSVIELLILHFSDGSKRFHSSDDDTRPARGAYKGQRILTPIYYHIKSVEEPENQYSSAIQNETPLAHGLFRIQDIDIQTCLWLAAALTICHESY